MIWKTLIAVVGLVLAGAAAATAGEDPERPRLLSWSTAPRSDMYRADLGLRHALANSPAERARLTRLLGEANAQLFDAPNAKRWYLEAVTASDAAERQAAQLGLARLLLFREPQRAEALLAGLAGVPAARPAVSILRARLAMARRDNAGAAALLRAAIGEAAGLGTTDGAELLRTAIADLSFATALGGDPGLAGAYLAGTPAGSAADSRPTRTIFPDCTAEPGLRSGDRAVFAITVNENGVDRIEPVWSSRPGGPELLLGRALARWEWPATTASSWRRGVHVSIGCSDAGEFHAGFDEAAILWRWFAAAGIAPIGAPPRERPVDEFADAAIAALAAREARYGLQSPQLIPALLNMANHIDIGAGAAGGHVERALGLAVTAKAPAEAIAVLRLFQRPDFSKLDQQTDWAGNAKRGQAALDELTAAGKADGEFGIYIRFMIADALGRMGAMAESEPMMREAYRIAATSLPRDNPWRRAAASALGYLELYRKNAAASRRLLAEAGVTASSCQLADVPPRIEGMAIGEEAYPMPLRRSEIEGSTMVERRVGGDGRTLAARTIYAQPPLLFDAASTEPFAGTVATVPPRRDGKPFPCIASPQVIRWQLQDLKRPE